MPHLTTLDELKQHVTLLASVEESDAPFISCYLNLEVEPDSWRKTLDDRARILPRLLKGNDLADFEETLGKIETWLASQLVRSLSHTQHLSPPCRPPCDPRASMRSGSEPGRSHDPRLDKRAGREHPRTDANIMEVEISER